MSDHDARLLGRKVKLFNPSWWQFTNSTKFAPILILLLVTKLGCLGKLHAVNVHLTVSPETL
jgi:hypothetical protein